MMSGAKRLLLCLSFLPLCISIRNEPNGTNRFAFVDTAGAFNYRGRSYTIYASVQAQAGDLTGMHFYHLPLLQPLIDANGTVRCDGPSATIDERFFLTVYLETRSDIASEQALASLNANDKYKNAALGLASILVAPIDLITAEIAPITQVTLDSSVHEGMSMPNVITLRFLSDREEPLRELKTKLDQVQVHFSQFADAARRQSASFQVTGQILANFRTVIGLNGTSPGPVYVHRDDTRKLLRGNVLVCFCSDPFSGISTSLDIAMIIENPDDKTTLDTQVINDLIRRWFELEAAAVVAYEDKMAQSTFNADDLKPDRVKHEFNHIIERNKTNTKWHLITAASDALKTYVKTANSADVGAGLSASILGFDGSGKVSVKVASVAENLYDKFGSTYFDSDQLATILSEHDITADLTGDIIIPKQILVREFKTADLNDGAIWSLSFPDIPVVFVDVHFGSVTIKLTEERFCFKQQVSLAAPGVFIGQSVMGIVLLSVEVGDQINPSIPTGFLSPFWGMTDPFGWLICDGRSVQRSRYPSLFRVIGTHHGSTSDTTFNLPDLRDRVVVGASSQHAFGTSFGQPTVRLETKHLPAHSHTVDGETSGASLPWYRVVDPSNTGGFSSGFGHVTGFRGGNFQDHTNDNDFPLSHHTHKFTATSSQTGGGEEFSIRPPSLALNWIIKF